MRFYTEEGIWDLVDDLRCTHPKYHQPGSRNILPPRNDSISLHGNALINLSFIGGMLGARLGNHHGIVGRAPSRSTAARYGVAGWSLDAAIKAKIDRILQELISDPAGPEFMAPPARSVAA